MLLSSRSQNYISCNKFRTHILLQSLSNYPNCINCSRRQRCARHCHSPLSQPIWGYPQTGRIFSPEWDKGCSCQKGHNEVAKCCWKTDKPIYKRQKMATRLCYLLLREATLRCVNCLWPTAAIWKRESLQHQGHCTAFGSKTQHTTSEPR